VRTRFEEDRGGNPLEIIEKKRENLQIATKSPWPPVGREWRSKRVESRSQGPVKGLYTWATKLVRWGYRTCPVQRGFSKRNRDLNNLLYITWSKDHNLAQNRSRGQDFEKKIAYKACLKEIGIIKASRNL
jgi:hypothetical protein